MPKRTRRILVITLLGILLLRWIFLLVMQFATSPVATGVVGGHLGPASAAPNGVCSLDRPIEKYRYVPVHVNLDRTWGILVDYLKHRPRVRLELQQQDYLHATFRTPLLGFIDDVEFYLDRDQGRIEYRSASRIGYHDMGTNAARIKAVIGEVFRRDQGGQAPDSHRD